MNSSSEPGRPKSRTPRKKIISVTMDPLLIESLDEIVTKGDVKSRAQLIDDAVRWYISHTAHRWDDRGIYVNTTRCSLVPAMISDVIFSKITPQSQYELGHDIGKMSPIKNYFSIKLNKDTKDINNLREVLAVHKDMGWGLMELEDDVIVVENPFYPNMYIKGYLEGILEIRLTEVKTFGDENYAFRIEPNKS